MISDFNEPYSSVSFSYKKQTSPYPYNNTDNILPNKLQITRWTRLHRKSILLVTAFILFILYLLRDFILIYLYFVKIKMDNTMFDRGYVSCGSLRKEPMLFVQDTLHVQVIWEMNCGMKNKEMTLSYWTDNNKHINTVGPIESTVLDQYHIVYKATIGPLDQGNRITYAINSQKKQIAKHTFDWFSDVSDQPIRIAAMADNQFGMLTFSSLLRQIKKLPKRKQPHFLLHAGDAVQNYPSLRQWQTDFAAPLSIHGLSQVHPMIYAHGNHDYDSLGEYTYTRTNNNDNPWFAFSMAKGAVRFIVLDSNVDWELQDTWLRDEIKSQSFLDAQFRIVVVHVPPFLEYWDPEAWFQLKQSEWGSFIKDRYVPLFEEGGVDLVISGHQHNYERGERNGIHYAIIGGAGGDIDLEQVKDWGMYEAKLLDFHFVMMEIRPPEVGDDDDNAWSLQWSTYDIKGREVDSVLITSHAKTLRRISTNEN